MSKEKGRIIPEKIHLLSIKVFKSNLETSSDFMNNPDKVQNFHFGINHEMAHNKEDKRTRLRLFFSLEGSVDEEKTELDISAEYGIELHFLVENFDDFYQKKGEEMQMDAGFGATLLGIAYSTCRGIILERMQGTYFEGVILPVIDPFKVLTEQQIDS